jgi:hypothetical protein
MNGIAVFFAIAATAFVAGCFAFNVDAGCLAMLACFCSGICGSALTKARTA